MKTKTKKLTTRFEPETRFDVVPIPPAPFRGTHETELERLKGRLVEELILQAPSPEFYPVYRRAANDAAALAWVTPFPLLVLPALLAEAVERAHRQALKQQRVAQKSRSHAERFAA